jgi:hypothetical protein
MLTRDVFGAMAQSSRNMLVEGMFEQGEGATVPSAVQVW